MNIIERANEFVSGVQDKHLNELKGRVEGFKRCGCHRCQIEATKSEEKYFDEYYFVNDKRHLNDFRKETEVDVEPLTEEETEDILTVGEVIDIDVSHLEDENEISAYCHTLDLVDVLVCFKYRGAEFWIYFDKEGKPREFGNED